MSFSSSRMPASVQNAIKLSAEDLAPRRRNTEGGITGKGAGWTFQSCHVGPHYSNSTRRLSPLATLLFNPASFPLVVADVSAISIAVALGNAHTCVIVASGGVKCWGRNDLGQLGIGSTGNRYSPVDVPGANLVECGSENSMLIQEAR
jgi:hypothetical protein